MASLLITLLLFLGGPLVTLQAARALGLDVTVNLESWLAVLWLTWLFHTRVTVRSEEDGEE